MDAIDDATAVLEKCIDMHNDDDNTAKAFYIRDEVLGRMQDLRRVCDEAETITAADCWPFPTYGDLLFGV